MILSKNVADQIVKELSQIVEQHINVMDIQGVIISSTDSNRIGTIHGGALKIIEENLPELVIESNDQFPGSKNGINLPIAFQGAIIGVIGMTGIKDEVYKYGQIIKKMTEILLLDSFVREQHLIEQKAKDRFL
ncbi:MAG: transcriptional regulator, partial [Tenericutes bacterium HGW-Tenericutes-3]